MKKIKIFKTINSGLRYCGRFVRYFLMFFVKFYQNYISVILPPACRFIPSCSNYTLEVLQTQPLLKSLLLIAWRLLRCQPLCKAGYDPAPPATDFLNIKKNKKNNIG